MSAYNRTFLLWSLAGRATSADNKDDFNRLCVGWTLILGIKSRKVGGEYEGSCQKYV